MRFNGVSKKENGKYVKIDGAWYTMPDNVRKFVLAQKFVDGEEINIKSHTETVDGREVNILDYIERIGDSPGPGPAQTQTKSYGSKTPEERKEIKRQAVMKAVCSAIGGCKDIDI